ncbi:Uncharacterized protein TCM_037516 [Theobroma cacao]|uniref:Uncharacterized protein n=1 Tax=Theobroma cacao TaxID=3641 RepID=A0A061GM84_THECC|nr:Uncharacterized protein TCM_037516 [Theobroma cacao]
MERKVDSKLIPGTILLIMTLYSCNGTRKESHARIQNIDQVVGLSYLGGGRAETAETQSQKNSLGMRALWKKVTVHVLPAPSANIRVEPALGPIPS